MRTSRSVAALIVLGVLAGAGCSRLAIPTSSAAPATAWQAPTRSSTPATRPSTTSPSPTVPAPTEGPTPTPGPIEPIDPTDGPPAARVTRDGVVLESWVGGATAFIGQRHGAFMRVTNGSGRTIAHQRCAGLGTVDFRAALPPTRDWIGIAGAFKRHLLDEQGYGVRALGEAFRHDDCGEMFITQQLTAGDILEYQLAWPLVAVPGLPIVPGPAQLSTQFTFWRPRAGPETGVTVTAATTIDIAGQPTPGPTIADYADIAAVDPSFIGCIASMPEGFWSNTGTTWWPNSDGGFPPQPWYQEARGPVIDLSVYGTIPLEHLDRACTISIEARTGKVLGNRLQGG